ncbi:copper resistance CopC family protein [Aneurinibacillus aneurinilyticus]|uniref:copper resistance CopC family protein n=1 Tax=Aneurinibacillus aneurinilyticus TaxID=1391 RepID=UPI0023F317AE|nr:copper resistance CopC family protein [Aneurinibacillus aneurinilyticus]
MKKIVIFLIAALMMMTTQVSAHSRLVDSSPKSGEIITKPVQEIAITFSANIEKVGKIEIKDEQGTNIPVSKVDAGGTTLKAILDKPLPNGTYTVNWMNIGEDGHSLRGDFSFQVNAPKEEPKAENPGQPKAGEQSATQPTDSQATSPAADGQSNTPLFIGIIIAVILLAVIVTFIIRKKR